MWLIECACVSLRPVPLEGKTSVNEKGAKPKHSQRSLCLYSYFAQSFLYSSAKRVYDPTAKSLYRFLSLIPIDTRA